MYSEIWRDIVEYEGFYKVSNLGRVRSLDRVVERGRSFSTVHKKRIGLANRNRTDQSKNVAKIDKTSGKIIKVYPSLGEAYRQTGVHFANISKVCKNKVKSAGGFKWEFIN